ncbi:hypothetical protein [Massilia sp. CF038]|uniref:hypothetical protein n=1 Tax=Massilia sp. CF038 TaxID=1881045 RepID=UPI0009103AF1|nr:hypothetical protein [Massilia sp. CF038]SHH05921.1 hypothetical protein SAMN05428948_2560 [Massilia sp. CF038]
MAIFCPRQVNLNESIQDMLKLGEITKDGHVIASIAAQDEDLLVYITNADQIRYFTASNAFAERIDLGVINSTMSKLNRLLDACDDDKLKAKLNNRIASSLYDALLSASTEAAERRFTEIQGTLEGLVDRHTAKLRIMTMHIFLTIIVAGVISIVAFYLVDGREFLLSAAAGGVGALFSILSRNSEITVQPFYSFWNNFLECFAKMLAGMIAAVFVVLAVKANVVLGFASSTFYTLFLSVLAGFSERFVPDFLSNTVKKISSQTNSSDGDVE